jgi:uncharacterized protein YndB with AHSA1/START domain
MDRETRTAIAFDVEAQIEVPVPPVEVWRALTEEIGRWWPHTFTDEPFAIRLEPAIGGRFYEQFDEAGAGALYATVTYVEPAKILRISGPMGMRTAAIYVKTYRLEPLDGGGTRVRTTASTMGDVPDAVRESYRAGGLEALEALRRHLHPPQATAPGRTARAG